MGISSPAITFTRSLPINSEQLAQTVAHIVDDKKAQDIVALDLRGISSFTDFFVICSGTSEPHLKAIIYEVEQRLKTDYGLRPVAVDGFPTSQWVVADYTEVVIHIFHTDKRSFYSLEDLWGDAPRLALKV